MFTQVESMLFLLAHVVCVYCLVRMVAYGSASVAERSWVPGAACAVGVVLVGLLWLGIAFQHVQYSRWHRAQSTKQQGGNQFRDFLNQVGQ